MDLVVTKRPLVRVQLCEFGNCETLLEYEGMCGGLLARFECGERKSLRYGTTALDRFLSDGAASGDDGS